MGVLLAVEQAPPLVLGLFMGAMVDRYSPRNFLIAADLARVVLLAALALAAYLGALSFGLLCAFAVLFGVFRTMFDVSYGALLPSIVQRNQLVDGNSQLGLARSVSEIAGPPVAGVLIQALSAGTAMLV